jgi:predicted amidohydrolase
MGQKLNIFLFQMDVGFGEPELNFKKLQTMLKSKSLPEDTLVVVPELFLTGYHKQSIEETATSMNQGKFLDRLIQLVTQYKVTLYGSIAEKDNGEYYNTAVLINYNGLISSYRKSHLFGPMGETELFSPGRSVVTTQLNDVKYGLSICYDLRFPYLYQKQAGDGADILLIVAEWPITRVEHWSVLLRARAIENQTFVVGVNRVGKDPDYEYGGYSAVYSPYGEYLFGIEHSQEDNKEGSIDLGLINDFRNKFDVRKDRISF